jgi:hypothetical protein
MAAKASNGQWARKLGIFMAAAPNADPGTECSAVRERVERPYRRPGCPDFRTLGGS